MVRKIYIRDKNIYKNCGFTLVELILVILILGILASIAIPQFIELRNQTEKSTVKTTLSSLETALYIYSANRFVNSKKPEIHNPFDDLSKYPINYNGAHSPINSENTPPSTWSYYNERNWIVYNPHMEINGGWNNNGTSYIVYQVELVTDKTDTVGMRISQYPMYYYTWK